MSLSVCAVERHATPSSAMPASATTSCAPIGIAPPSKSSSAVMRDASSSRPRAISRERSASAHSVAGTRASVEQMYRLPAACFAVAAAMCASATSRTSTTSLLCTGDLPSSHACTIATEKPAQPSRGGPKIIDGHTLTICTPNCFARSHATRSDSALENWYGSKPGPSRALTVFQSAAVYASPLSGIWPVPRTAAIDDVSTSRVSKAAHAQTIASASAMFGVTKSSSMSSHLRKTEAAWITASTPSAISRATVRSHKSSTRRISAQSARCAVRWPSLTTARTEWPCDVARHAISAPR